MTQQHSLLRRGTHVAVVAAALALAGCADAGNDRRSAVATSEVAPVSTAGSETTPQRGDTACAELAAAESLDPENPAEYQRILEHIEAASEHLDGSLRDSFLVIVEIGGRYETSLEVMEDGALNDGALAAAVVAYSEYRLDVCGIA